MSALPNQFIKGCDNSENVLKQFIQCRNDRTEWPISKIGERYHGGRLSVLLDLRGELGEQIVQCHAMLSQVRGDNVKGQFDTTFREAKDERAVFIDDVHLVQDQERLVGNTVGGFVRLEVFDPLAEHGIGDSLYHSLVTGNFLFRGWSGPAHGELNKGGGLPSIFLTRKLPHQIVQGGAKVVNDLPARTLKRSGIGRSL
jgi:hypothetical protein